MMDGKQIVELCLKHSLYSWSATGAVDPLPITRAEGVFMYTASGERILDFNSQLMSVNIGHSHPKVVATSPASPCNPRRVGVAGWPRPRSPSRLDRQRAVWLQATPVAADRKRSTARKAPLPAATTG